MSFLIRNSIDRAYISRINQETRILKSSKIDWDIEEVTRFATLLKIDESIATIIETQAIDGEMLFKLSFLTTQLELATDQTKFLPITKLFFVANAILDLTHSQNHYQIGQNQLTTDFFSPHNEELSCSEKPIEIDELIVRKLREQLKKMNDIGVIELSSQQVYRLAKNVQLMSLLHFRGERVELIRKWSIDGFSLVCTIANETENNLIGNYYSDQQLNFLRTLSTIFLHVYYAQYWETLMVKSSPITNSMGWPNTKEDQFNIDFLDINNLEGFGVKGSLGNSEYDTQESKQLKRSEYAVSISGQSIKQSMIGVSQRGSLKNSEYGVSDRGSFRQSVVGSVYASSQIMEQETNNTVLASQQKQARVSSSISTDENTQALMSVSLRLPFNLLNLQPLQRIKIATMPYPFAVHKGLAKKDVMGSEPVFSDNLSQRTQSVYDLISEGEHVCESKVFNLAGARFGRSPDNDFSYPDELSISGKHAQIIFRDEAYYIRDLGSKTGTFIYISSRKPLVLSQEQIIQLSYEVELKVVIVKNDINQGIIKFEFKKPDNQPPYRAILKNNNTVRIGKAEKSHIRLLNQSISSYHAQIKYFMFNQGNQKLIKVSNYRQRYEQGRFLMSDCNTRTGTWLRLSPKGVRSTDRKLSKNDIFRISSKKTYFVQDVTEHIHFQSQCPLSSMVHVQ